MFFSNSLKDIIYVYLNELLISYFVVCEFGVCGDE